MASRPKRDELHGLEGSTPSPSALMCPWPSGRGARLPTWRTTPRVVPGFDSRRALWIVMIGDRLVVGFLALNQETEVRPLLPELALHETCHSRKRSGVVAVGSDAWL